MRRRSARQARGAGVGERSTHTSTCCSQSVVARTCSGCASTCSGVGIAAATSWTAATSLAKRAGSSSRMRCAPGSQVVRAGSQDGMMIGAAGCGAAQRRDLVSGALEASEKRVAARALVALPPPRCPPGRRSALSRAWSAGPACPACRHAPSPRQPTGELLRVTAVELAENALECVTRVTPARARQVSQTSQWLVCIQAHLNRPLGSHAAFSRTVHGVLRCQVRIVADSSSPVQDLHAQSQAGTDSRRHPGNARTRGRPTAASVAVLG